MINRPDFKLEDFWSAKKEGERVRFLLNFAVLAPSNHNTQPWLFRTGDNYIEVYGNEARTLKASDSDGRQFFISIGCAIENILVASDYYGLNALVTYFPETSEPLFVSRIEFSQKNPQTKPEGNSLAGAILWRHVNRSDYADRAVPGDFVATMKNNENQDLKIDFVSDKKLRQSLIKICGEATEAAFSDADFTEELSRWFRPSLSRFRDGMPGYNIGVPKLVSFFMPFIIRHFNISRSRRKAIEKMLLASPAFVVISTKGDAPLDWVKSGMVFENIALGASLNGLKTSPLAAPIQIGEFFREVQRTLKLTLRPQVFFRIGYSDKIPMFSPRLNVKDVVV